MAKKKIKKPVVVIQRSKWSTENYFDGESYCVLGFCARALGVSNKQLCAETLMIVCGRCGLVSGCTCRLTKRKLAKAGLDEAVQDEISFLNDDLGLDGAVERLRETKAFIVRVVP